ncbi:Bifunctional purine biosynthetic protein ade1 [Tulasnella sp. 427]|nr:Bifunctional purine biosynthetic protein ade1 [Tulasnella sp. 427]
MAPITTTNLEGLKLISRGKVRDIYATSDPNALLFVATDRISAYDVILNNGIPNKGRILTQLSLFWFEKLRNIIPNHLITADIDQMPDDVKVYRDQLQGRSMLVRRAQVILLEAIVRGYITGTYDVDTLLTSIAPIRNRYEGSGWAEYKKSGTVHGISLPTGLNESSKLPEPLFTPSTKAEQGEHDENIHPDRARELIGADLYEQVSEAALKLYSAAAEHASGRGIILADTKFEFGLVESSVEGEKKELILIDEVLTPDSSRYWPVEGYEPGKSQPSFDKQYLRDWLVSKGFKKGLESGLDGNGWTIDPDVVEGTQKRYEEVFRLISGQEP